MIRNESKQGCMIVARCVAEFPDTITLDYSNGRTSVEAQIIWRSTFTAGLKYARGEALQANAPTLVEPITAALGKSVNDKRTNLSCRTSRENEHDSGSGYEEAVATLEEISSLHDSLYDAVASGAPLPKVHADLTSDMIAESLRECSIESWLGAVKEHNSYTHRHCMTVAGLAVAFAMKLGFSDADVRRMSIGGLMHDVGKVKIPIEILDKPGKLSPEQRAQINKHPIYGAEILRIDAQFNDEVIDLTLHHHELLDGSGYPDGLVGSQISDPVRILTIVDIFSALIDKRSYKEGMSADAAYQILLDMDGKLETVLVKAFEPVAFATRSSDPINPALQENTL